MRTSRLLAPILLATSVARLAVCNECWNVPGASSASFLRGSLLVFDSYTRVTFEVKPNIFSIRKSRG